MHGAMFTIAAAAAAGGLARLFVPAHGAYHADDARQDQRADQDIAAVKGQEASHVLTPPH